MGTLDDVSVVLTGGGSGLGRAIVDRFVEEGANVTVLDRSEEKLDRLAQHPAGSVAVVIGDVTSPEDNARAVSAAVENFGGIDVFIGNAGIWDFGRALMDSDPDELVAGFEELFSVNVKAYLLGARASADELRKSQGSMIFTLSNASFYPGGGGPLYTASKHAGLGLVKQLAYELSPEIRVNGVAPGGMATDLRGPKALRQEDQSISETMPIQDYLRQYSALEIAIEPEDYVGPYALLSSRRDSRTITGTVFDISSVGIPKRRTG